jgi:hypothetical protein
MAMYFHAYIWWSHYFCLSTIFVLAFLTVSFNIPSPLDSAGVSGLCVISAGTMLPGFMIPNGSKTALSAFETAPCYGLSFSMISEDMSLNRRRHAPSNSLHRPNSTTGLRHGQPRDSVTTLAPWSA